MVTFFYSPKNLVLTVDGWNDLERTRIDEIYWFAKPGKKTSEFYEHFGFNMMPVAPVLLSKFNIQAKKENLKKLRLSVIFQQTKKVLP